MVQREGADGITVTAEHKALLDDVALVFTRARDVQTGLPQYQTTLTLTRHLGPGALFTRARDVQTGLPGESEWRGSRLAQQRERCALHGGT